MTGNILKALRMRMVFLLLFLLALLPANAAAGPFGTQMGDSPEKYRDLKRVNTLYYETLEIPKPHSRISNYMLGFSPASGLSRVIGYTEFERDNEGAKAANLYQTLLKTLTEKYGQPSSSGGNMPGALWTKGVVAWDKDLPDNIKRITLSLYSMNGTDSRVDVFYVYDNNPTSEEWDKMDKDAL